MSDLTSSTTAAAIQCSWCGNDYTHTRSAEVRPAGDDVAVRVKAWCENCHNTTWIELYTVKGQGRIVSGQGAG